MRKLMFPLIAALFAAAATAGLAVADDDGDDDDGGYAVGLWGDIPYSDAQKSVGVPNLIADLNSNRLAFSVHDGDIKAGGTRCDDNVYAEAEEYFNALRAPAMYTPGDNEWTDCDRESNGSYDSEERLEFIRSTLFDTERSFGQRRIRLEVQEEPYVENRRWHVGKVTYATLHVVGSNNNLGDVAPDPAEWAARDAATSEWLRGTFEEARDRGSKAVMLIIQANPGFDRNDPNRSPPRHPQTLLADFGPPAANAGNGFDTFLLELRREVIEFGRPVALLHGDSHYFRVDKPLLDRNGHRIEHFTRVETPGDNAQSDSNDVQWVKAVVDTDDPEVFSFEHEVVQGNTFPQYTP
jgi:hypothetical protein